MDADINQIKEEVKKYISQHFLKNKQITEISDNLPLISGGLLDSISTMQLITHLEETYKIEFEAHEVDKDNFENVSIIAEFIKTKL